MIAKPVAMLFGLVLTLVGVAGFFVTDMLLVFQVDTLHNVIHLASGLIGLFAASKGESAAKLYLIVFGIVYAVVAILGFMNGNVLGLIEVNDADNYLHAAIAVVTLIAGFASKPARA